jgi:AraC family transcriptional regulator of adaptative response / DNA-3-methyladenine glycosylase II
MSGSLSLPRVPLVTAPTPLQPAPRLAAELGAPIWLKREDLTGLGLGGNKLRGLEYLLGDALARGCDCLVTGAGPQSNWAMLAALAARGETVEKGVWRRVLTSQADGATGEVTARFEGGNRLAVTAALDDLKALPGVLARVRRLFDLSADPEAIRRDLAADPLLAPLVEGRPGLRLPGAWSDDAADLASDRLEDDGLAAPAFLGRVERWRPWRAYGLLHLREAGIDAMTIMESMDDKDAARNAA